MEIRLREGKEEIRRIGIGNIKSQRLARSEMDVKLGEMAACTEIDPPENRKYTAACRPKHRRTPQRRREERRGGLVTERGCRQVRD